MSTAVAISHLWLVNTWNVTSPIEMEMTIHQIQNFNIKQK